MTYEELKAAFERHNDEYIKFDRIQNPMHRRPDVCAFMMLDAALPDQPPLDMVAAAEHDEIYLEISVEDLAAVATDDLIRDLTRCGVRYDSSFYCLAMFV